MSFHHYCFPLLALFWLHQMILSREHTSQTLWHQGTTWFIMNNVSNK
jgi:hypothetical protein